MRMCAPGGNLPARHAAPHHSKAAIHPKMKSLAFTRKVEASASHAPAADSAATSLSSGSGQKEESAAEAECSGMQQTQAIQKAASDGVAVEKQCPNGAGEERLAKRIVGGRIAHPGARRTPTKSPNHTLYT